ncbi:FliG C-terminal domain-containing protein [Limimaricola pyoseonensis]|uniref:Flagellar motor switch protein FliG n=1 Tax=Limimaricola pyoseonensis TaxID=521013 RepID=A0A1G6ZT74_9RHOB|nr:FliG C-terminal domain-containing protein [Limimaricola pyoseonensis]SDE05739.1 flagellar motor switch protein FliG [Limimaricola pyoseonensis]
MSSTSLSDPARPRPAAPPALDPRRKAAMVVQLVLSEGRHLDLAALPEEAQARLARELGALRLVDRTTLEQVAAEFADRLEGLGLRGGGGLAGALDALQGRISPATADRLRDERDGPAAIDPWQRLAALEGSDLLPVMQGESAEIAAVLLSKLPVAKAAELLGLLPGDRARRIAGAVSRISNMRPDTVGRIGAALAAEHCQPRADAFGAPAPDRLGAILNSSRDETREALLEGLETEDPAFAGEVRRTIFTFADIPDRVPATDVPKILRGLDLPVLIAALAAGEATGDRTARATAHLLENMSRRMAEGLREEMAERAAPARAEGEAAMIAVVEVIRAAEAAGEITLLPVEIGAEQAA